MASIARRHSSSALHCILTMAFLIALFPLVVTSAEVKLSWDENGEPQLAGYRIHCGTKSRAYDTNADVKKGNTSYVVTGLQSGRTYYFAVTALDTYGLESDYSNEVSVAFSADGIPSTPQTANPSTDTGSSETNSPADQTEPVNPEGAASEKQASTSGGGGGGCFTATAAFGSYIDPHVMVLRGFRDAYLMTNRAGRAFVRWYYATSPPIADGIRKSPFLKALVRMLLLPVIGFSYVCLSVGPVLFLVTAFVISALALIATVYRSRIWRREG